MRSLLAVMLVLVPGLSVAQSLVITAPAAPGGGWDQTARAMQRVLAEIEPGVNVQVENVPGAAGTIGLARFIQSERGNPGALLVTGLVMVSGVITNHSPVSLADATPIARLTGEYEIIVVPAASPYQSLTRSRRRVQEGSWQHLLGRRIRRRDRRSPGALACRADRPSGIERQLHRLLRWRRGAGRGARRPGISGGQRVCGVRRTDRRRSAAHPRGLRAVASGRHRRSDAARLRHRARPGELAGDRGAARPVGRGGGRARTDE